MATENELDEEICPHCEEDWCDSSCEDEEEIYPCEHGHYDCATYENGTCSNELASKEAE